jgi:hypothetical protein
MKRLLPVIGAIAALAVAAGACGSIVCHTIRVVVSSGRDRVRQA